MSGGPQMSGSGGRAAGYWLAPSDHVISGVQYTGGGGFTQGSSYFHTLPGSALISAARAKIPLASGSVTEVWTCGIWSADGTLQDSVAMTISGGRAVWRFGSGYLAPPRTVFTLGWWRTDNAGETWAGSGSTATKAALLLLAARGAANSPVAVAPNLYVNEPSLYISGQATMPTTVDSTGTTLRSGDVQIIALTGILLP